MKFPRVIIFAHTAVINRIPLMWRSSLCTIVQIQGERENNSFLCPIWLEFQKEKKDFAQVN